MKFFFCSFREISAVRLLAELLKFHQRKTRIRGGENFYTKGKKAKNCTEPLCNSTQLNSTISATRWKLVQSLTIVMISFQPLHYCNSPCMCLKKCYSKSKALHPDHYFLILISVNRRDSVCLVEHDLILLHLMRNTLCFTILYFTHLIMFR